MSALKEFMHVHYSHLTVSREAPRRDHVGTLSRLKSSLLARGVEEPLGVRKIDDSAFMVVSGRGYRRYLAINELVREGYEAKFQRIPVHVLRQGGAVEDALTMLASDVGEPLPAVAKAGAIRILAGADLPLSQIAMMTGVGTGELRDILAAAGDKPSTEVWHPATDARAEPPTPRQRVTELFAYAAQLPEGTRNQVAELIEVMGDYVDGRVTPAEAVSRLAQPKVAPSGVTLRQT